MFPAVEQIVANRLCVADNLFEVARAGVEAEVPEIQITGGYDLSLRIGGD